jgi:4-hydroxy-tetrahydrodipicolinate synthase
MTLHASTLPAVLSPAITPFHPDGSPDKAKLAKHCQWLQANHVGMAVFGTNSEANSMSVAERLDVLDYLIGTGLSPGQMMPGTGACAVTDAIALTRAAVNAGCAGTLMLPPFYYKDVSDDGLFAYFAQIIEAVASDKLQIYVYNIPPITKVGFSLALLERLIKTYPKTIVGIKDSSGDWSYTESVLKSFAPDGFRVYAGSESFLLRTMRAGGAGCISATTNVNPRAIAALAENWQAADAEAQQAALDKIRIIFQSRPMIPAMKAAMAHYSGDPQWAELRPPLVKLSAAQHMDLLQALSDENFQMPGV